MADLQDSTDTSMIRIHLLFFAVLREITGQAESDLVIRSGSSARDVWESIRSQYPQLEAYPLPPLTAINMEYVSPESMLRDGDELAFIPPVSGG